MSYSLCKYKNMFGEPNKNLRKYRIFDIAIMDVSVVIIFSFILSRITNYPFIYILIIIFILGIIAHRIFCVRTRIDRWLFS